MSVKRYSVMEKDIEESAIGNMVDYPDYAALEADNAKLRQENIRMRDYLNGVHSSRAEVRAENKRLRGLVGNLLAQQPKPKRMDAWFKAHHQLTDALAKESV